MNDIRLLQNFSGTRALVAVMPGTATEVLGATLNRLGVAMELVPTPARQDLAASLNPDQDIVVIDGDLDETLGLPLTSVGRLPPAPVIGLLGVAAPSRLKALLRQGATSILHKPVQGSAVFTALFVGVNEFRRRRQFECLLDTQERRLRGRRSVIKAVVRLMRERQIGDDEAYDWLRRESMASRVALEDICERIVAAAPDIVPENDTEQNRSFAGPNLKGVDR